MKFMGLYVLLFVLAVATGCVRSHRAATVVYTPQPTPAVVYTPPPPPLHTPLEPPSPPPTSRVLIPDEEISPPSEPPPGVSSQDLAVAESISKLLKNDAHMASISGNVQTTVDRGVVSLRGTVSSGNAMDEIALRISKLPGVHHIENHLTVSNR